MLFDINGTYASEVTGNLSSSASSGSQIEGSIQGGAGSSGTLGGSVTGPSNNGTNSSGGATTQNNPGQVLGESTVAYTPGLPNSGFGVDNQITVLLSFLVISLGIVVASVAYLTRTESSHPL